MSTPHKILVVDDERDFVTLIRSLLEAHGYETFAAYEGVRGVEMAVKQDPDLVLLDILMPAGNGLHVLECLRSQPKTKKLPVIAVTASQEPGLEGQVREKGAQDFLRKPFDFPVLLAKVKTLLED